MTHFVFTTLPSSPLNPFISPRQHFLAQSVRVYNHLPDCPPQVVREGGAIGVANVTWRVRSDPHGDLVASAGWLAFSDGQTTGDVVLLVRSDDVAELAEAFLITLTATSEVRHPRYLTQYPQYLTQYPQYLS